MTTVEEARAAYLVATAIANTLNSGCGSSSYLCLVCGESRLDVDGASLAYDLAVAEDVARRAVAWA